MAPPPTHPVVVVVVVNIIENPSEQIEDENDDDDDYDDDDGSRTRTECLRNICAERLRWLSKSCAAPRQFVREMGDFRVGTWRAQGCSQHKAARRCAFVL